jgi:hypothetical protein
VTEHSRTPVEPDGTQPEPVVESTAESTASAAESAAGSTAGAAAESTAGSTAGAAAESTAEESELNHDERAELERLRAGTADEHAELERLRAETAELHRQPAAPAPAPGRRRRFSWRALLSVVLIVLGCVIAPVAVVGVWAAEEVSNTGRYVATVQPLIDDPAIQNYLTDQITNQITTRLNITGVVNQASAQLNSKGLTRISSLLTTFGPQIASSVTGFIHSTVHSIITSHAMQVAWTQVNTLAHSSLVSVLSGQNSNTAVSLRNGQIVLNLGPMIDVVKMDLVQHGFKLASSIPPVSPTLALFQAKNLEKAQAGYRLATTLRIVLPILALVLLAGGVFAARNRRRGLIGAGLGLAASMLILAIGLLIARSIYLSSVPSNVLPTDAAAAAYDALVHFLKESLRVVLAVGLVVAIGAFFTGPSRTAVATRSGIKSGLEWIRHFGERRGVSTGPAGEWTYHHRRGLRIGAVALFALIFVFVGEPTAGLVILLVVLLLVVLGLIELIGRPPAADGPPLPPPAPPPAAA